MGALRSSQAHGAGAYRLSYRRSTVADLDDVSVRVEQENLMDLEGGKEGGRERGREGREI